MTVRKPTPYSAALLLATVGLVAAGCSSAEPAPEPPEPDGGLPASCVNDGCVDIAVDGRVLDQPEAWAQVPIYMARQPFWVDERGVHMAWVNETVAGGFKLIVSSFDRDTGEVWSNRVYDVYPAELGTVSLYDAAGSADGSFAVLIGYGDDTAAEGFRDRVVLGNLDEQAVSAFWDPPWSVIEAAMFHVGFDGEAFAVHATDGPQVRLVRLAPDGTVVTPETGVGLITSLLSSAFHTDGETGTTWLATPGEGGLWLSGHYRNGTPLAGTEADGGVVVSAQGPLTSFGETCPGIGWHGAELLLGWRTQAYPRGDTRLQRVTNTTPVGDALVIVDEPTGFDKVITWWQDAWWMAMVRPEIGIEAFRMSSADGSPEGPLEITKASPLVVANRCPPTCHHDRIPVPSLSVRQWQGELWFGFWDYTDCFSESGPPEKPASCPYRIVRVKDGCCYLTEFERNNP